MDVTATTTVSTVEDFVQIADTESVVSEQTPVSTVLSDNDGANSDNTSDDEEIKAHLEGVLSALKALSNAIDGAKTDSNQDEKAESHLEGVLSAPKTPSEAIGGESDDDESDDDEAQETKMRVLAMLISLTSLSKALANAAGTKDGTCVSEEKAAEMRTWALEKIDMISGFYPKDCINHKIETQRWKNVKAHITKDETVKLSDECKDDVLFQLKKMAITQMNCINETKSDLEDVMIFAIYFGEVFGINSLALMLEFESPDLADRWANECAGQCAVMYQLGYSDSMVFQYTKWLVASLNNVVDMTEFTGQNPAAYNEDSCSQGAKTFDYAFGEALDESIRDALQSVIPEEDLKTLKSGGNLNTLKIKNSHELESISSIFNGERLTRIKAYLSKKNFDQFSDDVKADTIHQFDTIVHAMVQSMTEKDMSPDYISGYLTRASQVTNRDMTEELKKISQISEEQEFLNEVRGHVVSMERCNVPQCVIDKYYIFASKERNRDIVTGKLLTEPDSTTATTTPSTSTTSSAPSTSSRCTSSCCKSTTPTTTPATETTKVRPIIKYLNLLKQGYSNDIFVKLEGELNHTELTGYELCDLGSIMSYVASSRRYDTFDEKVYFKMVDDALEKNSKHLNPKLIVDYLTALKSISDPERAQRMFAEFSKENLSDEQRIDVDMNSKVYIGALFGGMADLPAITKLFDTNIAKYSNHPELNNPVVSKVNVTETADTPVNDKTESCKTESCKTESCKPVTQPVPAIKRVRNKRYNRQRPVYRPQRQTTQPPQPQYQPQYAPQTPQVQYQPQYAPQTSQVQYQPQYAPQTSQVQYQPQYAPQTSQVQYQPQYAPQVLQPQYQWCIVGYMPIYAHIPQF